MAQSRITPLDYIDSEAPFTNEFRRLLSRVKKHMDNGSTKTIMLTSAMLSEGKSTTAAFLALTAAEHGGLKTLVVDADLRRPSLHRIFGLDRDRGLSDILIDGFDSKEAIRSTHIDKLDVMTSGTAYDNPSAVFDAESIGMVLEDLKFYYDLILVDAPPLMPVSDPMLLATKVDAILLVVKAGDTDRAVVKKAVEGMGSTRDKVLGVVLNNLGNKLPYYYDHSYYGYDYKPSKRAGKRPTASRSRTGKSRRSRSVNTPRDESITRQPKQ
ncbi:MAG: CpsD/CapB family tyrosine-protein kinase [bacterium]|nr:CpsD/CapB family tyrosine-protein kinase [bacterium]